MGGAGMGMVADGGFSDAPVNAGSGGGGNGHKCPWTLFVGQLPFTAGEEDLMHVFGRYGDILECKVLRKSGSQESKGCGFVTYAIAENAANAINALNQQAAMPGHARRLIVHYAK
jgi:RNA recognition motif-containing protein